MLAYFWHGPLLLQGTPGRTQRRDTDVTSWTKDNCQRRDGCVVAVSLALQERVQLASTAVSQ